MQLQLCEVGYFSRTHGVKGQVVLKTTVDLNADGLQALFVEVRGSRIPYFLTEAREGAHGLIVTLEEIDSPEKARSLLNKPVFAHEQHVVAPGDDEIDLVGFEIIDEEFGSLGTVSSVEDNGAQEVLEVTFRGKSVLLPLVEDFIVAIDEKARTIRYRAPQGLISIFLEDSDPEDR